MTMMSCRRLLLVLTAINPCMPARLSHTAATLRASKVLRLHGGQTRPPPPPPSYLLGAIQPAEEPDHPELNASTAPAVDCVPASSGPDKNSDVQRTVTGLTNEASAPVSRRTPEGLQSVLSKAARRAIGGGLGGLIAGVLQVICLMWLRTAMNYQYAHGVSTAEAMRSLYAQGGVGRFYRGIGWAIIQTPLSRFGDTACNAGALELLAGTNVPLPVQTALGNAVAALWRVALTPLDTYKTTLQVAGAGAYAMLTAKVRAHGVGMLYAGCVAAWLASFVGGFPWFAAFNALNRVLPSFGKTRGAKLLRRALLGVCATSVSDCIANSIRVLKTARQTASSPIGYAEALRGIVAHDGWAGLFTRGLRTRLLTNCLQAALFTVVWKQVEEWFADSGKHASEGVAGQLTPVQKPQAEKDADQDAEAMADATPTECNVK